MLYKSLYGAYLDAARFDEDTELSDSPVLTFSGMANRFPLQSVPEGCAFEAINVMFDNAGAILFPRYGYSSLDTGSVHSINDSSVGTLYVKDGSLMLWADPTPILLLADVGDATMSYTRPLGGVVYFSNGTITGKYKQGDIVTSEWGTAVPPSTMTVTPITSGGMFEGEYRVAIAWIATEESGVGSSIRVSVVEGGGIELSNLPTAPDYVTHFSVWVSSLNGELLYYYNEYPIATTTVTIGKFIPTVELKTQWLFPPQPPADAVMIDHYGHIFYFEDNTLCWTYIDGMGPRYGLREPLSSVAFDSDGQTIISCPGVLYVGTLNAQYKIINIDGDGPPIVEQIRDCGAIKGSEVYHENGIVQYYMSKRGLIEVTPEDIKEVTYDKVAIPYYSSGTSTIVYKDGMEYLFFAGKTGVINPLSSLDYTDDVDDAAWAVNLSSKAVSKFTGFDFVSLSGNYAGDETGLYEITGNTDNGAVIGGYLISGKMSFKNFYQKRVPDIYIKMDGGKVVLRVSSDNSKRLAYVVPKTKKMLTVKVDLARGARGDLWQFELSNSNGSIAIIQNIQPVVTTIPRRV